MRASEVYKNLPAGIYRELKISGQSTVILEIFVSD